MLKKIFGDFFWVYIKRQVVEFVVRWVVALYEAMKPLGVLPNKFFHFK